MIHELIHGQRESKIVIVMITGDCLNRRILETALQKFENVDIETYITTGTENQFQFTRKALMNTTLVAEKLTSLITALTTRHFD